VTRPAANKVVILDRDGTIVIDRHYLSDPAGLEFLPGAAEGLRSLYDSGYRLIVITNQSGIGRGLFSIERLQQMNARLCEMVLAAGARLEGIYFCPHRPEDRCDCRKPGIQLLLDAASTHGFDPAQAVVIGDQNSDVEFGRRAGAKTILVNPGASDDPGPRAADYVVRDLREAATILRTPG
jgi:D-glycero-D-manno-heptose 1,7-bisphosphate phosphatase